MRITVIRTTMKLRQISRVESSIFLGSKEERSGVSRQSKGKTLVTCLDVSLSSTFRSQALWEKKKKNM